MPVVIDRKPTLPQSELAWSPDRIDIGLVNNMPDTALEATERQYISLLEDAAQDFVVGLKLFTLPEIVRSDRAAQHIKECYRSLDALWHTSIDALIITGTEPIASDLRDEPYWGSLTEIIDWAADSTLSTIFSCLAAHAGVLHLDGITRRPMPQKLFGIFEERVVSAHTLTSDMTMLVTPHSRWNELDRTELASSGYSVLSESAEAGVGVFTKDVESLFIFIQGHPEYEAETLLREYRRDIGRFLRKERKSYPERPQHYFDAHCCERIEAFRRRALSERRADLLAEFPIFELRRGVSHSWRPAAVALYRNWLQFLITGKPHRMAARILKEAGVAMR